MDKLTKEKLIKDIGEKRYLHSLRVFDTGKLLGKIHNVELGKIKLGTILHDCAKFKDRTKILKTASKFDIMLDNVMKHNIELIHGPLGARLAEEEYGIKDMEVLDAIRYHTTGRENMTILDKIIYISDYIEPRRSFKGVEEVRQIAFINIDKAMLMALENTIRLLMKKERLIHVDTIMARNDLRILIESV